MGSIAALVAGGLVLALEIWTIVPAPGLSTLALAAVVPEVTPWAIGGCLIAGVIAQWLGSGWARNAGVGCAAAALGFALVPWCLLPATIAGCERELRLGFGAPFVRPPPATAPPAARPSDAASGLQRPYDLGIALGGFDAGGTVRRRPDLPVRTRDGRRLGLDLYLPAAAGPHPAVIVIYGGAWIFGSRAGSAELAQSLAALGYTAIALDYRHAPQYRFPTQLDDIDDALATVARNAAAWQVDPRRVAIVGRSAGAQLALLAAYARGPLTIRAAVGYYAPTDLAAGYHTLPQPDPADVRRILRAYIGGPPDEHPAAYRAASPVAAIRPGLPPTLLVYGARDELVLPVFARELRDALRLHGNRAAALEIPWSNHAFDSVPNGTAGQLARFYTQRFLAAEL